MTNAIEEIKSTLNMLEAIYKLRDEEIARLNKRPFCTIPGMREAVKIYTAYFGEPEPKNQSIAKLFDTIAMFNAYQLYNGKERLM